MCTCKHIHLVIRNGKEYMIMLKEKGVHKENTMASQAYSVRMFTVVLKYIHIFSLAYLASRVSNTENHSQGKLVGFLFGARVQLPRLFPFYVSVFKALCAGGLVSGVGTSE